MPLAPPDPALGVFETLLVRDGRVQALAAHLERLSASVAELYGAALPAGLAGQIRARAAELVGEHRLRVDASPDEPGVAIDYLTSRLNRRDRRPVTLSPAIVPGGIGRHKWSDRGWLDGLAPAGSVALTVDRDGSVLEAAWANVWLLEGQDLVTPPADGRLLPGITRARLLELAPEHGFRVSQAPLSVERMRGAEAVFLTSALRQAVPARLEDRPGSRVGLAAVRRIRAALERAGF